MDDKRNIIVLGETGVGKSSLINMLVGREVAVTSDQATGCTFESTMYEDNRGNRFYDTVGLNEASRGTVSAKDSIAGLVKLLRSLKDGVNLVIFMIKKGRITETMQKNYTIFVSGVCQNKVPVILAVSGCEMEEDSDRWFNENKEHFDRNGMKFDRVVCGCFAKDRPGIKPAMKQLMLEAFEETEARMLTLLGSGRYNTRHTFGTFITWIKSVLRSAWNYIADFFGWPKITFLTHLKTALMNALGLSEKEAIAVANEIEDASK